MAFLWDWNINLLYLNYIWKSQRYKTINEWIKCDLINHKMKDSFQKKKLF